MPEYIPRLNPQLMGEILNAYKKNEELKRALASKERVRPGGANGQHVDLAEGEPEMTPQDRQMLRKSDFKWDPSSKLYKKALKGSKKALYYDPVSKKRFSE